MRSLAVKIFLSFWLAQVVILVVSRPCGPASNFYPPPPPRPSPVFIPTPVLIAAVVVSPLYVFFLRVTLRRRSSACEKRADGSRRAI